MPAPIASTFFSAPAISQPTTSGFVYTRNVGPRNSCCSCSRDLGVGRRDDRRRRLSGRDLLREVRARSSTPMRDASWPASTSATTSVMRSSVPCSTPFDRLITGAVGVDERRAASASTARNPCDGTPTTTTSAPVHAASSRCVARNVGGSAIPGR